MSGSCHLDRASNVKIAVEYQIFVIVILFDCGRDLQFGAHSRYYQGALTQKRSLLVICTTFRQSHYREVAQWEIFMEQEFRFGLDLGRFGTFEAVFSSFHGQKIFKKTL